MIKIGLAGGRGYVGEELLGLLQSIDEYQVVYVGSRGSAGKLVNEEYQGLEIDMRFQDLSADSIRACRADAWIIAQPNDQAKFFVDVIDDPAIKIIDISSDYRFDDEWVYGLPEKNQQAIESSTRIANPGCYATATQLALLPLRDQWEGLPVAFGISGFSGAGRTPGDKNDPARLADNIIPYTLVNHTHEREVSRHLGHDVRFAPHVAPFFRGITMTVHAQLVNAAKPNQLHKQFKEFYDAHPLVRVTDSIPEIQQVANTNNAMVGGFAVHPHDPRRVTIISVIDNLRKGAASQAIQNLNLMFGLKSHAGLMSV